MYPLLITPWQLQTLQAGDAPLRVFDCSFDLMDPEAGARQFEQQHIAGAHYAHLERDLSAPKGSLPASAGRHPLPARAALADWLGRHGVQAHTQVVVYDRQGCNFCGRLWWLLQWCGHEAVAVLDGGWSAWLEAGGAVQSGPAPRPLPGSLPDASLSLAPGPAPFALRPSRVAWRETQEVAQALGAPHQLLIDARAPARYRGEVEPLDPVAGHIPGALNRPFSSNLDAQGRFLPPARLRAEFLALLNGRDPAQVVHQCGSGVSAIPNLLAMALAGLEGSCLYPGSWSAWSNTPGLPSAHGEEAQNPALKTAV